MIESIYKYFSSFLRNKKRRFQDDGCVAFGSFSTSSYEPSIEPKTTTRYCLTISKTNPDGKKAWVYLSPDEHRSRLVTHNEPIFTTENLEILTELVEFMKDFGPLCTDENPVDFSSLRIIKMYFAVNDVTKEASDITKEDYENLVKRHALMQISDEQAKLLGLKSVVIENKILKSADPKPLLKKAGAQHFHKTFSEIMSQLN